MSSYSTEEIVQFLEAREIPKDFTQWDFIMPGESLPAAHVAARLGILPREFSKWDLKDPEGWTVAHHCAQAGTIRPGFRQWGLSGPDGLTVAHVAAEHGTLPKGFQLWEIHDGEDWTVAHAAAKYGTLPRGFDRWDIGKGAWSVAHEAAESGSLFDTLLPDSTASPWAKARSVLSMVDGNGASVAWVAINAGRPISCEYASAITWRLGANTHYSVAHAAAAMGLLPEGFNEWEILDEEGATVAHTAAMHGHLPRRFKEWDLLDTSGWSVLEIAVEYGHYTAEQISGRARFYEIMDHLEATESLPAGFTADDLALCDDNGFTIAHEAGYRGLLDDEFDGWHWATKDGRTVAHETASAGQLPAEFDQWGLVDKDGWTVAHEVAQHASESRIPEWIQNTANQTPKEMWSAADIEGVTVGSFFKDLPDKKPDTLKL